MVQKAQETSGPSFETALSGLLRMRAQRVLCQTLRRRLENDTAVAL
jgi:hypothetical protein